MLKPKKPVRQTMIEVADVLAGEDNPKSMNYGPRREARERAEAATPKVRETARPAESGVEMGNRVFEAEQQLKRRRDAEVERGRQVAQKQVNDMWDPTVDSEGNPRFKGARRALGEAGEMAGQFASDVAASAGFKGDAKVRYRRALQNSLNSTGEMKHAKRLGRAWGLKTADMDAIDEVVLKGRKENEKGKDSNLYTSLAKQGLSDDEIQETLKASGEKAERPADMDPGLSYGQNKALKQMLSAGYSEDEARRLIAESTAEAEGRKKTYEDSKKQQYSKRNTKVASDGMRAPGKLPSLTKPVRGRKTVLKKHSGGDKASKAQVDSAFETLRRGLGR